MTTNQLTYFRDLETKRHNIAMENETQRHDVEQEAIGYRQAAASQTAAYAAMLQAENAQRLRELQERISVYDIAYKRAQTEYTIAQHDYVTAQTDYVQIQSQYTQAQTAYVRTQDAWTQARTAGQQISNQRESLAYTLDLTYADRERGAALARTVMQTITGYSDAVVNVAKLFQSNQPKNSRKK